MVRLLCGPVGRAARCLVPFDVGVIEGVGEVAGFEVGTAAGKEEGGGDACSGAKVGAVVVCVLRIGAGFVDISGEGQGEDLIAEFGREKCEEWGVVLGIWFLGGRRSHL